MPIMKEFGKPCTNRPLKSIADLERKYGVVTAKGSFQAGEIRKEVDAARSSDLIRLPGEAWHVKKDGLDATALGKVKSQWMDVTPALAKRWLENNFRNRPISEDVVQAYARDIINGVWVPTHQGIAFNDRDELIDGQHRLHAIILSGKTIRMMVTFGLPSEIKGNEMTTMDAVDRGRTRSVADQLRIQHGMKDGSIIAAVCASLGHVCHGTRTRRLSVGQTLDIFRSFEEQVKWVIAQRSKQPGLKAAGLLAGFAFSLATEEDFETPIAGMYESLVSGEGLRRHSPMSYLHKFLTSEEAKLLNRGSDRALAEIVLQAIHQELKNVEVSKLDPGLEGVDHFRAKQTARVQKIAEIFKLPEVKKA